MSEALKAVMEFFFERVEANRIESLHDPNNPHSGMVMKKCGMKYEGRLRSSTEIIKESVMQICMLCYGTSGKLNR